MEKVVDYKKFRKAEKALAKKMDKLSKELFPDENCDLVNLYIDDSFRKPVEWYIGWAGWESLGSVPAEDAKKFAKLIVQATKIAEKFTYNGYMVIRTDED